VVVPGARRRVFYLYGPFLGRTKFPAECWEALTGSELLLFDNRKRWQVHADNPPPFKDGKDVMAWTITSFARVEHNCGKQRRTYRLPDETALSKARIKLPGVGYPPAAQFEAWEIGR